MDRAAVHFLPLCLITNAAIFQYHWLARKLIAYTRLAREELDTLLFAFEQAYLRRNLASTTKTGVGMVFSSWLYGLADLEREHLHSPALAHGASVRHTVPDGLCQGGASVARTDEFHEFSQVYSPRSQICAIRVDRSPFFEKAMQVQDVRGPLPAKVPSS